ncbi:unnamed protein product [Penicillium bialowiezense]
MNANEYSVPYWLPKLAGKVNWVQWRQNIEEAVHQVKDTSVYWDIIMDKPDYAIRETFEAAPPVVTPVVIPVKTENSPIANSNVSSSDPDVVITGTSSLFTTPDPEGPSYEVYNRSILNIRARQILASSLAFAPRLAIDRISDPHEAYLKLETIFGKTSPQSIYVRYVHRGLTADRFLERFKQALYDVRGQGVDVSPSVELALFMQSIKSHCNSTKFLADMKASIYAQDFMDKVYEQFLEDQSAGIAPSMTILDALREDVEL